MLNVFLMSFRQNFLLILNALCECRVYLPSLITIHAIQPVLSTTQSITIGYVIGKTISRLYLK